MVTFLIVLLVIISVAISIFVLIQNPKGGGLVSGGGSTNMFGVQRTGDVLEKGTWVMIALIVLISLSITTLSMNGTAKAGGSSAIQERLENTPGVQQTQPIAPVAAPAMPDTSKK